MRDDDEREELDDERPARRRRREAPKSGTSPVLYVALAVGLLFVLPLMLCGGAFVFGVFRGVAKVQEATQEPQPAAGPVRECKVGEAAQLGDLSVTVESVGVGGFLSTTASGRTLNHDPALLVQLRLKNTNPNRVIELHSQNDKATAADDVGNTYKTLAPLDEFGSETTVEFQSASGLERRIVGNAKRSLRSDRDTADLIILSRPVPGAAKLTITVDGAAYGASGTLKIHATKEDWQGKPPAPPKAGKKK